MGTHRLWRFIDGLPDHLPGALFIDLGGIALGKVRSRRGLRGQPLRHPHDVDSDDGALVARQRPRPGRGPNRSVGVGAAADLCLGLNRGASCSSNWGPPGRMPGRRNWRAGGGGL